MIREDSEKQCEVVQENGVTSHPMGTRPGQIDPGVVLYLITEKGMSASDVQALFYHECGLKGLSGISNDMRQLQSSSDPRAALPSTISSTASGCMLGC